LSELCQLQPEAHAIRAQVTIRRRGVIKVEQYGRGMEQMAKVMKYHSKAEKVKFCIKQSRRRRSFAQ